MPISEVLSATVKLYCESCHRHVTVTLDEPTDPEYIDRDAIIIAEEKHGWQNQVCYYCKPDTKPYDRKDDPDFYDDDFDSGDFDPYHQ